MGLSRNNRTFSTNTESYKSILLYKIAMTADATRIHIILAGGTIDSVWDPVKDTAIPAKESETAKYLKYLVKTGKVYVKFKFTQVVMKDSRDLTRDDINKIYKTIVKSPYRKIIITHGTYTMPDTARFIKNNMGKTDKTIILTGALIPLQGFQKSDAPFNLGYSIAQLEHLKPGVYLCANAHVFNPEEVAKDMSKAQFYSAFKKH